MAPADAGHEQLADEAAPLDVLLADAAAGPLRRFAPDASTAKFAVALARRPVTTARRLGSLAAELARIGAGTSALAPAKRDRRFADPAWTGNLLLRRVVQAYLAAGRTAGQMSSKYRSEIVGWNRARATTTSVLSTKNAIITRGTARWSRSCSSPSVLISR